MAIIEDKEIDFSEQGDLLNEKPYAEALASLIKQDNPKDKSLVIGLLGEWGSGKSSIIKTTENLIKKEKCNKKIKFITYDAWKYSKDSFRRTFLLNIQEELKIDRSSLMDRFYKNTSESMLQIGNKKINIRKRIFYSCVILFMSILVKYFFDCKNFSNFIDVIIFLSTLFTGVFGSISVFAKFLDNFTITQTTPLMFAPEQFEECFNEITGYALKKESFIKRSLKWIIMNKSTSNLSKLVIVIDNIDRCDSETCKELLNNIKNFLTEEKNIIFIIPTDDKSLCNHLTSYFNCEFKKASEYLRKIFDIEIFIKPFVSGELFDFTKKLNEKYGLGLSGNAINIISEFYASNPRRIIQYLNNIQLEFNIIRKKIKEENTEKAMDIICKLSIIKEEWPDYYKLILNDYNKYIIDFRNDDNRSFMDDENLLSFLDKTSGYSIDEKLLEIIISNDYIYQDIPQSIKNSVNNLEFKNINSYINEKKQRNRLIEYIISDEILGLSVNRGLWETKTLVLFRNIFYINSKFEISKDYNARIKNKIKSRDFDPLIRSIYSLKEDEISYFINYLNLLHKQKLDFFFDRFVKTITFDYKDEKFKDKNDIILSLFDSLIHKFSDTKVLSEYSKIIKNVYLSRLERVLDLKPETINHIISEDFIDSIIDGLVKDNETSLKLKVLTYIIKSKDKISNDLYGRLFDKMKNLYDLRLSNLKALLDIFNNVKLDKIPPTYLMQPFNHLIIGDPDIMYDLYNRKVLYNKNIFTEKLIKDDSDVNSIIDFLVKICKFTDNKINVIDSLKKIIQLNNKKWDYILSKLKEEIKPEKDDISYIKQLVLSSRLNSEEYCYWLKELSIRKDKISEKYILSDKELSMELATIFMYSFSNNNDQNTISRLNELLEFLNKRREIALDKIIDNIYANQNNFEKLSADLKTLVLDRICEFFDNHKNNEKILEIIAKYGSKNNIKLLINYIKSNINDNVDSMLHLYGLISDKKISKKDKEDISLYVSEK